MNEQDGQGKVEWKHRERLGSAATETGDRWTHEVAVKLRVEGGKADWGEVERVERERHRVAVGTVHGRGTGRSAGRGNWTARLVAQCGWGREKGRAEGG